MTKSKLGTKGVARCDSLDEAIEMLMAHSGPRCVLLDTVSESHVFALADKGFSPPGRFVTLLSREMIAA